MTWSVYIIQCSDGSLYTGITTNVERRFGEHAGATRRAKFFNGRSPRRVVWTEHDHDQSSAARREAEIKKLTRRQKLELIDGTGPHFSPG